MTIMEAKTDQEILAHVETATDLDSAELIDATIIGAARDAKPMKVYGRGQVAGESRAWTMGGNVD